MQSLATAGQGRNSSWEVPEWKVLKEKNKLLLETAKVRRKMANMHIISLKKKSSSPVRLTMGPTQEEQEIQTVSCCVFRALNAAIPKARHSWTSLLYDLIDFFRTTHPHI